MIFFANTLTARSFPDERTIWTELRSRFIRASAVHTIGLHAQSFIRRPKPRNQGNEGQSDVHTDRKITQKLRNKDTTQQPARDSEGELAAAAAAQPPPPPPLLLQLLLLCCFCAAAVLLLLHDPRCIAEHKPSQQTVPRLWFLERT